MNHYLSVLLLPDGWIFILSSMPPLGGPHSQFPAGWNTTTTGLVKLGFAVLMGETIRISFIRYAAACNLQRKVCILVCQQPSPGETLLTSGVDHITCLPSELQRINRIWPGQHLVSDWSHRKPGCEGRAGTGRGLSSTCFYLCFTTNCDGG